jgi:hypothetical protein
MYYMFSPNKNTPLSAAISGVRRRPYFGHRITFSPFAHHDPIARLMRRPDRLWRIIRQHIDPAQLSPHPYRSAAYLLELAYTPRRRPRFNTGRTFHRIVTVQIFSNPIPIYIFADVLSDIPGSASSRQVDVFKFTPVRFGSRLIRAILKEIFSANILQTSYLPRHAKQQKMPVRTSIMVRLSDSKTINTNAIAF